LAQVRPRPDRGQPPRFLSARRVSMDDGDRPAGAVRAQTGQGIQPVLRQEGQDVRGPGRVSGCSAKRKLVCMTARFSGRCLPRCCTCVFGSRSRGRILSSRASGSGSLIPCGRWMPPLGSARCRRSLVRRPRAKQMRPRSRLGSPSRGSFAGCTRKSGTAGWARTTGWGASPPSRRFSEPRTSSHFTRATTGSRRPSTRRTCGRAGPLIGGGCNHIECVDFLRPLNAVALFDLDKTDVERPVAESLRPHRRVAGGAIGGVARGQEAVVSPHPAAHRTAAAETV